MADLYKGQVKTDVAGASISPELLRGEAGGQQIFQKTGEILGQQVLETRAKITERNKRMNVNEGTKLIQDAYRTYQNDPEKFNETVNNGTKEYLKNIQSDEEKQEFLVNMELTKTPYNNRVHNNFVNHQEKLNLQAFQDQSETLVTSVVDNIGTIATDTDTQMGLAILVGMADKKDKNGYYMLTQAQRSKINTLNENKGYYAFNNRVQNLALRPNGDKEIMKLYKSALSNKKQFKDNLGISEDKYLDLMGDMSKLAKKQMTAKESVEKVNKNLALESNFKAMDIKDGIVKNEEYNNLSSVISMFNDYQDANKQGYIANEKFISNASRLAEAGIKMIQADVKPDKIGGFWWDIGAKTTVEGEMVNYIDGLVKDAKIDVSNLDHFGYYKNAYATAERMGIDIKSTDPTEKTKAMKVISGAVLKRSQPDLASNYTDEELQTDKVQKEILTKATSRTTKAKTMAQAKRNLDDIAGIRLDGEDFGVLIGDDDLNTKTRNMQIIEGGN